MAFAGAWTIFVVAVSRPTIEVTKDGGLVPDTVSRGQAATRWIDRLRGKKFLRPVLAGD